MIRLLDQQSVAFRISHQSSNITSTFAELLTNNRITVHRTITNHCRRSCLRIILDRIITGSLTYVTFPRLSKQPCFTTALRISNDCRQDITARSARPADQLSGIVRSCFRTDTRFVAARRKARERLARFVVGQQRRSEQGYWSGHREEKNTTNGWRWCGLYLIKTTLSLIILDISIIEGNKIISNILKRNVDNSFYN